MNDNNYIDILRTAADAASVATHDHTVRSHTAKQSERAQSAVLQNFEYDDDARSVIRLIEACYYGGLRGRGIENVLRRVAHELDARQGCGNDGCDLVTDGGVPLEPSDGDPREEYGRDPFEQDNGVRDLRDRTDAGEPVYTLYDANEGDAWIRATGDAFTHVNWWR